MSYKYNFFIASSKGCVMVSLLWASVESGSKLLIRTVQHFLAISIWWPIVNVMFISASFQLSIQKYISELWYYFVYCTRNNWRVRCSDHIRLSSLIVNQLMRPPIDDTMWSFGAFETRCEDVLLYVYIYIYEKIMTKKDRESISLPLATQLKLM